MKEKAASNATDSKSAEATVEELRLQLRERDARIERIQLRAEQIEADLRAETREARARLERSFEQRLAAAKNEFVRDLLGVFDTLDLVVEQDGNLDDVIGGVNAVRHLLLQALQRHGIERIKAVGGPFDPTCQEAVDTIEVPPDKAGTVVAQMRAGYRIGDMLLRPACVTVGKASDDDSATGDSESKTASEN